ncbi:transposase [Geobacillus sp. GHH01]|uniref:transposase n=1 Tax=Geobacillus sp. GHH01 TaxID=1233873 RepID=UPI001181B0B2
MFVCTFILKRSSARGYFYAYLILSSATDITRKGYRSGSYPRQLMVCLGRLLLCVPRIRDGEFSTELF